MKYVNKEKMLRSQGYMQKKPIQNNTTKVHHPHPNNNSSKNNASSKKSKLIKGTSIAAMGLTGLGLVGYVISRSNDDITKMNKNKKADKSLEFGKFTNKLEKKKANSDHKADHTNQKIEKKKKLSNDKNKSKNASEHINNEIDMLTKFSNAKMSPKTYEHKLHDLKAIDAIKSDSIKQNTNELSKLAQKAKESKLLANSLGVDKKELDKTIKQDKILRPIMPVKPITSKPESSVSKPVVPVKPVTPRPEPVVPKPVIPVKPVTPKPEPVVPVKPVTPRPEPVVPKPVVPVKPVTPRPEPVVPKPVVPVKPITPKPEPVVPKPVVPVKPITPKPEPVVPKPVVPVKPITPKPEPVVPKPVVPVKPITPKPEPVVPKPVVPVKPVTPKPIDTKAVTLTNVRLTPYNDQISGTTNPFATIKIESVKDKTLIGQTIADKSGYFTTNLKNKLYKGENIKITAVDEKTGVNTALILVAPEPVSQLPVEKIPNGTTKKVTFVKADGTKIGEGELVKEGTSVKVNNLPDNYKLIDKSQLLQWPDRLTLNEDTSKPASTLPAEKIPNGATKKVIFVKADGTKIGEGELVKEGTSVKVNNLPGNYKLIDKSQLLQWPDQLTLIEETKH
ncbi:Ig-like domain-containing protein [Lactobacillus iners]|uniref:Ig-like domain-containing protein n=1 Tax=Lactobacillus iners TaxID=147802 RepID=UPI0011AF4055|nr:Ig-like domain-containing protein [Lactobacillus iners]